jgi:hypothetical protein
MPNFILFVEVFQVKMGAVHEFDEILNATYKTENVKKYERLPRS